MNSDRPLDGVTSVAAKLALLVGASVLVAALVSEIGDRAGVPLWITLPVTVAAALGVTRWLSRGMTSPLRAMTDAAGAMATGDYSRRVPATSADEVGRLARAFNTMAADLAAADRERRQLVATVSHELRTPLAAQQALLENLVDGVVRPDDAVLRSALAQAERLGSLVEDLLDLSRLDGGRTRLDLERVDVTDLVARGVAEADVTGRAVHHEVEVSDGLVVDGDPARLAQALANLLDNAGRHSPPGGTVHVRAGLADGGRWFLEVADDGPGIPPERAERAFERFGSWDESGGGTGIGLAIVSWVCALHGGTVAALPADDAAPAQEPGDPSGEVRRGARVRAVLPLHPQAPPPRLAVPAAAPAAGPTTKETTMSSTTGAPSGAPAAPAYTPRPFVESLFGDFWPEQGLRPRPDLLLGSLGVGFLAAVLLPERLVGLGVFLVLVAAGALVLHASPRRSRPWTVASAVLCVGLASLTVLRAAEWLYALMIPVVGLLVTVALTDSRRVLPMALSAVSWVLAGLRGLPLLGRTVTATSRHTLIWPVLRTAAVTLVLLVVFGGLFASGDAVFGSWVSGIVPDLVWDGLIFRAFVLFFVGGVVLAATYLAINPPRVSLVSAGARRPVARMWEWAVPVGVVVALFVGFIAAQAAALFGGQAYLTRTTGLTYAEYVHQGFGQMIVATLLTLVTVGVATRFASRRTRTDRLVLRAAVAALSVLTLAVVASAVYRIGLYQEAYGFTVARLVALTFELWLGLVVVMVLVAGVRLRGSWLPRAALASGAVVVLGLGLMNPEAWVAQRNIDRYEATGRLDSWYLAELSPDAAPVVEAGLPADLAACIVLYQRPHQPDDLWSWNLGRSHVDAVDPAELDRLVDSGACRPGQEADTGPEGVER